MLLVLGSEAKASVVRLGAAPPAPHEHASPLAAAAIDFGGGDAPFIRGLPDLVQVDVADRPQMAAAADLLVGEALSPRCGSAAAFQKIAELLIIQLLRHAIETGAADGGLLAGLADPRLSRALTAMHDAPSAHWSSDALAELAGMSRSRFIEHFSAALGEPPMRYLTGFRMLLARQELEQGRRVGEVARRYGYSAPDAFSRAYRKRHGAAPRSARKAAGSPSKG